MLTKRKTLAMLGFAAITALVVSFVSGAARRPTAEDFAMIHEGMTRSEVNELLGGPAGNYTSGPIDLDVFVGEALARESETVDRWDTDVGLFLVWFNEQGRVESTHHVRGRRVDETMVKKLLRWFGL